MSDSKRSLSVSKFGRIYKSICDQLAAIGQPIDETDKVHWFLCGLGPSFETFSAAHRSFNPCPLFRDLLAVAEGHEIFLKSIHGSSRTPPMSFNANTTCIIASFSDSSSAHSSRGGRSGGRGCGRRPPDC